MFHVWTPKLKNQPKTVMLVRFDFSEYDRRPVPEELTRVRLEKIGARKLKFWALDRYNLEDAPVLEKKRVRMSSKKYFVANAERANDFIKYGWPEELTAYKRSIKPLSKLNLRRFETGFISDYETGGYGAVIPYYPEVIEVVE